MARPAVTKLNVITLLLTIGIGSMNSSVSAQSAPDVSGKWTLNPALTVGPPEIGFGVDWATPTPGTPGYEGGGGGGGGRRRGGGGGGGGGRGGGAAGLIPTHAESEADARRLAQLTAEARGAPTHLTIVDTPSAVTITTDDSSQPRTFHPTGQDEVLKLDGWDVSVNTRRDAGKLLVLYTVEESRLIRYTYTRSANPAQLTVEIEFIGRGGGDHIKRVYEPTRPDEPKTAPAATAAAAGGAPARPGAAPQPFNQQPDAEFRNLTKVGLVVEGLGDQAVKCGLTQDALEASIAKHLTDGGFRVQRNTDEDTYVYISVMTASLSTGYCVSRYDAYVYSHTTATLTYQSMPVLVEVSLWHKGGIAGGAPAANADGVIRGLADYIDQFATRVKDANKPKPSAP